MQQHPLFITYKRRYLSRVTGYSMGYLCRIATGGQHVSRSFIERLCFSLNRPEENLFLFTKVAYCSRAYIYVELAKYGVTPKDVIEGRWRPPVKLLKNQSAKLKSGQKLS